jgi:hypothetical protein
MNHFTKEETGLVISNAKKVIEFIRTEILPCLKTDMTFRMNMGRTIKDLVLSVHGGKNGYITIYQGHAMTLENNYTNPFDYFFSDVNVEKTMALIKNWKDIKRDLLEQVEKDAMDTELIKNFQV